MHCFNHASEWAWGTTSPRYGEVFGFFTNSNLKLHINAKEFQAAIFALRSYMMRDPVIQFYPSMYLVMCVHFVHSPSLLIFRLNVRNWFSIRFGFSVQIPGRTHEINQPTNQPILLPSTLASHVCGDGMNEPSLSFFHYMFLSNITWVIPSPLFLKSNNVLCKNCNRTIKSSTINLILLTS